MHLEATMTELEATFSEHLRYSAGHRALICVKCRHTIKSGDGVYRHFRTMHPSVDLKTRKSYSEIMDAEEPDSIAIPERGLPMVDGLNLLKGYECHMCGYVCASEGTMKKH